MSWTVPVLVGLPTGVGAVLLVVRRAPLRNTLVVVASVLVTAASVAAVAVLADRAGDGGAFFGLPGGMTPGYAVLAMDGVLAGTISASALNRRWLRRSSHWRSFGIAGYLSSVTTCPTSRRTGCSGSTTCH